MSAQLTFLLLLITTAAFGQRSPLADRVAAARRTVESAPKEYAGWNELAQAVIDQANASGDTTLLSEAERALRRSREMNDPGTDLRRLRIQLLLAQQKYAAALEQASALNRAAPDDVLGYGYMAAAQMALGRVADAETSVQWMLDLRRNDPAALERAGQFRLLINDPEGAAQMLEAAFQRTPPEEIAARAFILTRLAKAYARQGKRSEAIQTLEMVLQVVPEQAEAKALLTRLRPARARLQSP